MTEYQQMLERAYAEFDALIVEEELQQRGRLRAAGWSKELIDKAVNAAAPFFAEQRARIPQKLLESMNAAGVPMKGVC